jgi:hypothetical protein
VFVAGPYYAGRRLRDSENVVVRQFEPRLPALLAAADVAVIKPGNNVLSEALAGRARLVLVPDVSFMEGLDEHAARVAARFGGAIGRPNRESLEPLIRDALSQPARQDRPVPSGAAIDAVVQAIHEHADSVEVSSVAAKRILLVLVAPSYLEPGSLAANLPDDLRCAVVLDDVQRDGTVVRFSRVAQVPAGRAKAVVADGEPGAELPQDLIDRGVRLLLQPQPSPAVERWLRSQPSYPLLLTASAELITAQPGRPEATQRRIAQLLRSRTSAALLLDLDGLSAGELEIYLDSLGLWVAKQPLRLVGADEIATEQADRLMRR